MDFLSSMAMVDYRQTSQISIRWSPIGDTGWGPSFTKTSYLPTSRKGTPYRKILKATFQVAQGGCIGVSTYKMSSKNPPKQIIGESKKFSIHGIRLSTVDPDPSIWTVPGSLVGHSNAQPFRLNQSITLSNTFLHIWTRSSLILQQLFHYSIHFANLNFRVVVKVASYNQFLFIASIVSFLVRYHSIISTPCDWVLQTVEVCRLADRAPLETRLTSGPGSTWRRWKGLFEG